MILLNIGGTCFSTSKSTLEKQSSFFSSLITWHVQTQGNEYFVDRDPTHFRYILNYMRGNRSLPNNYCILQELLEEADFYCMDELKNNIANELEKMAPFGSIEMELYLLRQKINLMHS